MLAFPVERPTGNRLGQPASRTPVSMAQPGSRRIQVEQALSKDFDHRLATEAESLRIRRPSPSAVRTQSEVLMCRQ